jgi:hypothetical protein
MHHSHHPSIPSLQEFTVTVASAKEAGARHEQSQHGGVASASSFVSWAWRQRCQLGDGPCAVGVPAVGDSVLTMVQPASQQPPEPCSLTVTPGLSAPLLGVCMLGVSLLLYGGRALRSAPGVALVRLCCIVLPLLSALLNIFLLAGFTVMSTAMLELALQYLPVAPPRCVCVSPWVAAWCG